MGRRRVWSRDMRLAERSLRSLLFVPGDSERKRARAIIAGADALILDLEDSVANAQLPAARARVAAIQRRALHCHETPGGVPTLSRIFLAILASCGPISSCIRFAGSK